eukprot:CAMPEP_0196728602 /NCGR_PEP_ID=MMETSP1091-20130531/9236_1 /TAXON_ID=302021 /ORGANISM="Rhodomonas sp., Strain CCMP768" /LENGTH=40 /DNA_ID= /DNA_START= /DNA_END= /DNA_ORIENTATION=
MPAAGNVTIQPKKMIATIFQFTARTSPLAQPTAAVDPHLQ